MVRVFVGAPAGHALDGPSAAPSRLQPPNHTVTGLWCVIAYSAAPAHKSLVEHPHGSKGVKQEVIYRVVMNGPTCKHICIRHSGHGERMHIRVGLNLDLMPVVT